MHYNGYLFLYSVGGGADTNEGTRSGGTRARVRFTRGGRIRLGPPISKARAKEASATLLAIWATAANLRGRDNR